MPTKALLLALFEEYRDQAAIFAMQAGVRRPVDRFPSGLETSLFKFFAQKRNASIHLRFFQTVQDQRPIVANAP